MSNFCDIGHFPLNLLVCSSHQIFEAEQDNLYFEHVSAGKTLIAALQHAVVPSIGTAERAGTWQVEAAAHCSTAVRHLQALLRDPAGQSTYQPTLFRYFFLSLCLAQAVVRRMPGDDTATAELKQGLAVAAENASIDSDRVHPWILMQLKAD